MAIIAAAALLAGGSGGHLAAPAGTEAAERPTGRSIPSLNPTGLGGPVLPSGSSSGQVELRADAHDPSTVPNEGAEMNLTGFSPPTLPSNSTFQVSLIDVIGPYQAVFGIFMNTTIAPIAFYAIYGNLTDKLDRLVYWQNMPIYPGQGYLFAVTHVTANDWQFTLNGVPFDDSITESTVDLNVSAATWSTGLSYAVSTLTSTSFAPATVVATVTFATLLSAGWYLPRLAIATDIGSLGAPWGIEGNLQHPTLPRGEVVTGPTIAPLATGAALWNGSAEPILITVTVAPTTVPANGQATVDVTASRPGGAPVASAYVQLFDSAGSRFQPATVATGASGNGSALLLAPNTTSDLADRLTARSSLLGYYGSANTTLTITSVVRVLLAAPNDVTVATSGSINVDFRSTDPHGRTLTHIPLAFTVNATASVSPEGTFTDGSGQASARVQAPADPTTLLLRANVVGAGYWGAALVVVHVVTPTVPWYDRAAAYLAYGLLAVLAGTALFLLIRRARVPPRPLPPFVRDRRPPARPTAPGPSPPGSPPPGSEGPSGPGQP